jgi:hypothetical protein
MKRIVFVILALCGFAAAQSVELSWNQSTVTTIAGYNMYRAPCTTIINNQCTVEGTFVKISSILVPNTRYTDTNVVKGLKYVYYVTAFCPAAGCPTYTTLESDPSNKVVAVIPNPLPPPVLGPVTVAYTTRGANQNIVAQWKSTASPTRYSLKDAANRELRSGTMFSSTGNYQFTATVKKALTPFNFTVCEDASGQCLTAVSN